MATKSPPAALTRPCKSGRRASTDQPARSAHRPLYATCSISHGLDNPSPPKALSFLNEPMQLLPSNQATYKASERSPDGARGVSANASQEREHTAEAPAAPQCCLLDETGAIVAVNAPWHERAEANPLTPCQAT